jgi:CBS domain-containing protein
MFETPVRKYMNTNIVSASENSSIKEVVKLMAEKNIGSVIIVNELNKPVGIVTERDIIRALAQGKTLENKVSEIMSSSLITIKEDSPITSALTLMRTYNIRHLPVVDDSGNLKGVISIRDVVKAIDNLLE